MNTRSKRIGAVSSSLVAVALVVAGAFAVGSAANAEPVEVGQVGASDAVILVDLIAAAEAEEIRVEAERVEAERLAAEEAARVAEVERLAAEAAAAEKARIEAERLAAEEAERGQTWDEPRAVEGNGGGSSAPSAPVAPSAPEKPAPVKCPAGTVPGAVDADGNESFCYEGDYTGGVEVP